jgi:hypothetical protein
MLLEFLLFVTPGSALMFFILRFIKAHAQIGIARTDTARAEARMIDAQEAAQIAGETAREAMGQVTDALQIARTIELVDGKLDYVVAKIDGSEALARRSAGKHARALPSANDLPAITANDRIIP